MEGSGVVVGDLVVAVADSAAGSGVVLAAAGSVAGSAVAVVAVPAGSEEGSVAGSAEVGSAGAAALVAEARCDRSELLAYNT